MDAAERLVVSTQELLWERGYVGTSPKAIQQRAQAGQGSMYHHFTGKADLALAAIRRNGEDLRQETEKALSAGDTAIERIFGYLDKQREILRGCRVGGLAQDADVVASEDLRQPVAETLGSVRDQIAQVLAEGQQRGELTSDFAPEEVAASIAAVVQGGYVLARAEQSEAAFTAAVSGLKTLLLGKQR